MTEISFEFFPPKTDEQRAQLSAAAKALKAANPSYVSVTFGAGGSTLSYTPETVRQLREAHELEAAPHISCMGGTRAEIRTLLEQYRAMGCKRLVALRGDLPSGMASSGDFRYANELVQFIRRETGDWFRIEVAIPSSTRKPRMRRPTWPTSSARLRLALMARSPSTFSTPTHISASSTMCGAQDSTSPSCLA